MRLAFYIFYSKKKGVVPITSSLAVPEALDDR